MDRSCWLDASGPPVPEPDVRLDDTRGNRTSSTESEDGDQSRCNTLAGHTKIFLKCKLRADPRAHLEGLNRRPASPAGRHACGIGNSGPDGRPCPVPCPDTAVAHARHANAGRPADRPHCNTSLGDASVEMASRTPSTSTADAGGCGEAALESARISGDAGHSPREVRTPDRSSRGAERLFRSATPFTRSPTSLHPYPYTEPRKPPSTHRTRAPVAPPNWFPLWPPPTYGVHQRIQGLLQSGIGLAQRLATAPRASKPNADALLRMGLPVRQLSSARRDGVPRQSRSRRYH